MVVHTCDLSICEAGQSQVQGQPELHSDTDLNKNEEMLKVHLSIESYKFTYNMILIPTC
jgi:hypothetical protein